MTILLYATVAITDVDIFVAASSQMSHKKVVSTVRGLLDNHSSYNTFYLASQLRTTFTSY